MSFESYHYADVDDYSGYQPNQNMTDEQKANPPKGGSGIVNLTDSLVEDKLIDRVEALEKRIAYLEKATGYSIEDTFFMRG
jgi:hypothetical protein